jgi:hypothetical protein
MIAFWVAPIAALGDRWWASHTGWADPLRALGVVDAWRHGLWDARWFPNFDHGYGYPFLSYYAPLFHWCSGGWTLLLGSATAGVRANLTAWLALGTAGMYVAAERFWSLVAGHARRPRGAGVIAAIGWLGSPYPLADVYVRGDGAEFAALQLLPWTLWAALGVVSPAGARHEASRCLVLAAVVAAGILAHNFLGLVVVGLALATIPLGLGVGPSARGIARRALLVVVGVGWALLLSKFFWLPALMEMGFTRIEAMRQGYFHYANHFVVPANLLRLRQWGFGVSVPGAGDLMPLHLGVVGAAAALSVAAALWIGRRDPRCVRGVAVATAATSLVILVTTPASAVLWRQVPLLQFAQFPWRLLSLATVGVCLLLPAAVVAVAVPPRPLVPRAVALASGLFVLAMHDYRQVAALLPPVRLEAIDWHAERVLTTDLDEYGPVWRPADRPPSRPPGSIVTADGLALVRSTPRGMGIAATFENDSGAEASAVLAYNYFPGWRGTLGTAGTQLPLGPEPETGFVRIGGLPTGTSEVTIEFGDTPVRRACKAVSLVAWVIWVGVWALVALQTFPDARPGRR